MEKRNETESAILNSYVLFSKVLLAEKETEAEKIKRMVLSILRLRGE